jgi:hypothetical protein
MKEFEMGMACIMSDRYDKCVQNIGQETWVEKDSYETQVQLLGYYVHGS